MASWLFQSRPDRYDLREKLQVGKVATWYVTRYRNEMKEGDDVYFWMAGSANIRGVYGRGSLIGEPFLKPDWDAHGVKVRYSERLASHISVEQISTDPVLRNMLILRAPSATNFLLSDREARSLRNLF